MVSLRYTVLICAVLTGYYCQDHVPVEPPNTKSGTTHTDTTTQSSTIPSSNSSTSHRTTPTIPTTITTQPPTTTTPISHPTTTNITPTTSITTTVKPTTSQPTPPTTSKPTPPTTEKPTTPTTAKPTPTTATPTPTTAKPTPTPDPAVGNWNVSYKGSNHSCVVIDIAVQFEVVGQVRNKTVKENLPANATATGACDKDDEWLSLSWDTNNTLRFGFSKVDSGKFELKNITSSLLLSLSDNVPKVYQLEHKNAEFSTPLSKSYKCAKVQTLNLTDPTTNKTVVYLHISHTQFQAFGNVTGHSFASALDCEGSVTPDIVPIVVGCVLAALVIMVLIAYLIGRRRCQARGYLSMFRYHRIDGEGNDVPMRRLFCFDL